MQGNLAHKKTPTPLELPEEPRHGPIVGSYVVAVSRYPCAERWRTLYTLCTKENRSSFQFPVQFPVLEREAATSNHQLHVYHDRRKLRKRREGRSPVPSKYNSYEWEMYCEAPDRREGGSYKEGFVGLMLDAVYRGYSIIRTTQYKDTHRKMISGRQLLNVRTPHRISLDVDMSTSAHTGVADVNTAILPEFADLETAKRIYI